MSESNSPKIKFSEVTGLPADQDQRYQWPALFYWQYRSGHSRIWATIPDNPIELILALLEACGEPFAILHVIKVARRSSPGRYQLEEWLDFSQLRLYLARFGAFLTEDGRQECWFKGEKGLIVYDKHETLYLYGPLEVFEDTLLQRGFSNSKFAIDFPHYHQYHPEFDEDELAITESENYIFTELQETDID